MSRAGQPAATLRVGYVARAHGIRGEVAIKCFDPQSDALLGASRLILRREVGEPRELEVVSARPAQGATLVCLRGVEDRSAAEALRGFEVEVLRSELPPPKPGEYFQGDLVGLEAVDESGAVLGQLEEIWATGPTPNLVIRGEGKEELIVPFAEEFVPSIDLERRRIVIRPPQVWE